MKFNYKMNKIIFSYRKLKERIDSREDSAAEKAKALKNLDEIRADYSSAYMKPFESFLGASLAKLYDDINWNENGLDLQGLIKDNSVVLVPNHQSHADYLAINFQFYKTYNTPLYVAGGNNLNIFPIGKIFRKTGCFFIRRSFASDILYKLTLEAYLYYLLHEQKPIEFFFEGGRSRTGKLRPPRYGLYQMLLEAHDELPLDIKKPLKFVPVSIVHEYVPEQKSLTKELKGGKKVKESSGQLLGLVKLLSYQFGSVHINLGSPIEALKLQDEPMKKTTQRLAFDCFRAVGKNLSVTPTSLLAMIFLDQVSGALPWNEISQKARSIVDYCKKYDIPVTNSLRGEDFENCLGRALDILIGNKKVDVIGKNSRGQNFYSIKDDSRQELLYFKNSILHHFLVPWIINFAWINIFNGSLNNVSDLKKLFLEHRKLLKHEFYLPSVKEFMTKSLLIIGDIVGREVESLDECLSFTHNELYKIASSLGMFSRSFNYIIESYYTSALTIKHLGSLHDDGFKNSFYEKEYQAVHKSEKQVGKVVLFVESNSEPLIKNSMKYLLDEKVIENNGGDLSIIDMKKLDGFINKCEILLKNLRNFNLKAE